MSRPIPRWQQLMPRAQRLSSTAVYPAARCLIPQPKPTLARGYLPDTLLQVQVRPHDTFLDKESHQDCSHRRMRAHSLARRLSRLLCRSRRPTARQDSGSSSTVPRQDPGGIAYGGRTVGGILSVAGRLMGCRSLHRHTCSARLFVRCRARQRWAVVLQQPSFLWSLSHLRPGRAADARVGRGHWRHRGTGSKQLVTRRYADVRFGRSYQSGSSTSAVVHHGVQPMTMWPNTKGSLERSAPGG